MVKDRWAAYREPAFWGRVVKKKGGCWLWTGATDGGGYGRLGWHGRHESAHRVSWMIANGPIPAGGEVRHMCHNAPCVNPAHLTLGTHAENMKDLRQSGNRKGINRGADNGRAKLTYEDAEAIRERYASERISQQALADEYGVHQTTISMILRNKRFTRKDGRAP